MFARILSGGSGFEAMDHRYRGERKMLLNGEKVERRMNKNLMKLKRFMGQRKLWSQSREKAFLVSEVECFWWIHETDNKWSKGRDNKFKDYYVGVWMSHPEFNDITHKSRT